MTAALPFLSDAELAGRQRSEQPPTAPAVSADQPALAGLQPPDHAAEPAAAQPAQHHSPACSPSGTP